MWLLHKKLRHKLKKMKCLLLLICRQRITNTLLFAVNMNPRNQGDSWCTLKVMNHVKERRQRDQRVKQIMRLTRTEKYRETDSETYTKPREKQTKKQEEKQTEKQTAINTKRNRQRKIRSTMYGITQNARWKTQDGWRIRKSLPYPHAASVHPHVRILLYYDDTQHWKYSADDAFV